MHVRLSTAGIPFLIAKQSPPDMRLSALLIYSMLLLSSTRWNCDIQGCRSPYWKMLVGFTSAVWLSGKRFYFVKSAHQLIQWSVWTELQVTAWRRHCFQRRLWLCYTILRAAGILREKKGVQVPPTSILLSMLESDSYGNLPASLSWSPHEILTPRSPSAAAAAGLQCQSSCSNSCVTGVVRSMEDTSCDTSFAVDCTLSLGTAASRPDIPAQLSRSGSPALDPAWQRCSTSEQVDAATLRTHVEDRSEQIISWTSSSGCSNPNLLQEFYPQVRKTPWKWPVLVMSLTVTISITP